MRVLLYLTELNPGNMKGVFHFGPVAIATYLQARGHEVHFRMVNDPRVGKEEFLAEIELLEPQLIGFSSMSDEWPYVTKLAGWTKSRYSTPIVCGGAHPTMAPEEAIADPGIDIVCRGEGELAITELCACLEAGRDYSGVENLWVKRGGDIHRNPVRDLIHNLDDLPFLDTGFVDYARILAQNGAIARIMVGRGCPFDCTYCINHAVHALYKGKGRRVRRRSPENVIRELLGVVERYDGVSGVGFDDDTFSLDKAWLKTFCVLYTREIGLPFGCFMRVEGIDREFLTMIRDAGGLVVQIGVESGNEWLRKNVLGRGMSNRQLLDACRLLDEFDIDTVALNMVGLPHESTAMFEETLALNRRLNPSRLFATPFQPYPGTRLREIAGQQGWLPERNLRYVDRRESLLHLPQRSQAEISTQTSELMRAGYEMSVKKSPLGVYDFLAHLPEARIEQTQERAVEVCLFNLSEDFVLKAYPPAVVTYRLTVPRGAVLDFGIGLHESAYEEFGDGVLFLVEIMRFGALTGRERLFARYVNPRRNVEERGWTDCEVAVEKYWGSEVEISFVTRPGPVVEQRNRLAGWRRPCLTRMTAIASSAAG